MDSNVFSLADDTPQVWLEEEERGVGGGARGAVPGGQWTGVERAEGGCCHSSGNSQWRPEVDQKAVDLENEGRIPVDWM